MVICYQHCIQLSENTAIKFGLFINTVTKGLEFILILSKKLLPRKNLEGIFF